MNRRQVLTLAGATIPLSGGFLGWYWLRTPGPSVPDNVDIETLYYQGDVFLEPQMELTTDAEYYTVVRSRTAIEGNVVDDHSVQEFLEKVSFDEGYLIVVQHGMQPDPDLVLERIERTTDGLSLEVAADHPWFLGVDDALTVHSLLIRVTDHEHDVPESVALELESYE